MSRLYYSVLGIIILVNSAISLPVQNEDTAEEEGATTETVPANETQNLYVIRSVVYEIGILTDGDDDDSSNETHEQIDVSFFDPSYNGSLIDLSNIPLPIQTNISGVAVTGILPADLGSISLNEDGTASYNGSAFPILPNKQVRVTHNISTVNKDKSSSILSGLPKLLGLDNLVKPTSNNGQDKETSNGEDRGKDKDTDKGENKEQENGDEETASEKDLKVDGLHGEEDEGVLS